MKEGGSVEKTPDLQLITVEKNVKVRKKNTALDQTLNPLSCFFFLFRLICFGYFCMGACLLCECI